MSDSMLYGISLEAWRTQSIPEFSQGFYYRQTNFVVASLKCWRRRKSFLSCPVKQNLFSTQSRSTGNSWFSHNVKLAMGSSFSKAPLSKEVLCNQRKQLGITINCIANSKYVVQKQWEEFCESSSSSKALFCSVLSQAYGQVFKKMPAKKLNLRMQNRDRDPLS